MSDQQPYLESSGSIRHCMGVELARIALLDPLPRERKATRALRRVLLRGYGERCGYCLRRRKVEAAHIIPLEIGATTTEENLILLCRPCHRHYDAGHFPIASMANIASDWRRKIIPDPLRLPLEPISGASPAIAAPPAPISAFLENLLPFERLRQYRKAIDAIERECVQNGSRLGRIERLYLSIKRAELIRRRAVPGAVLAALKVLQEISPTAIPAAYQPLFFYELSYVHRLLGKHAQAAHWLRESAQAMGSRRRDIAYVAAATNEVLCEIAARDRFRARQAARFEQRLRDLEGIASTQGGFWGGRWVVNCAAAILQLKMKLKDASQTWPALERLRDIYFKWDVRTGWALGARPTLSQLEGMVRVLFPRQPHDLETGIGLLARSFMTRLAPRQRPEGVRDVGFALAVGLRNKGEKETRSTAALLDGVMSRTIDGTSVQWPWRG